MSPWMKQQVNLLLLDKKKLGLIIGLFCVMLLLWGRLILKQVPRTAVAKPATTAVSTTSHTPSTDALRRKVNASDLPVVEVKLPPMSKRDLFALDLTAYPTEQVEKENESTKQVITKPVDEVQEYLNGLVGRIRLESTVQGARPCAVINGQIIKVGQSIEGLVLKEVLNRQVILEYRDQMVRLRMN